MVFRWGWFFYELESQGILNPNFLQKNGILRNKEILKISDPRKMKREELMKCIQDLSDLDSDLSNVSDLKELLSGFPADAVVGRKEMEAYLGE